MTTIPNDDFDMCCGNRPLVEDLTEHPLMLWKYQAVWGICSDFSREDELWKLMIDWNSKQRSKA